MMSRFLLAAGILASSILSPLTAHAYLAPEDVLNDDDFSATYFSPPPSQREIDAVMEAQRERSAARREAEQAALTKEGEVPQEEEPDSTTDDEDTEATSDLQALIEALQGLQGDSNEDLRGAAGEEPDETDTSALTTEELREQRLLERIRQQQLDAQRAAQYGWMTAGLGIGNGETLHSGAPLSETGPATVLIVLALAGAVGETWRRVRRAERK